MSLPQTPANDLTALEGLANAANIEKPGPWTWAIQDVSEADLIDSSEMGEMSPVLAVSPCDSCIKRAGDLEVAEWEWGRCITPSKAVADHIAAANPTAVLALIRELRTTQAEVARLKRSNSTPVDPTNGHGNIDP